MTLKASHDMHGKFHKIQLLFYQIKSKYIGLIMHWNQWRASVGLPQRSDWTQPLLLKTQERNSEIHVERQESAPSGRVFPAT